MAGDGAALAVICRGMLSPMRGWVLVMLGVAGCGRIGFDGLAGGGPDGAPAPGSADAAEVGVDGAPPVCATPPCFEPVSAAGQPLPSTLEANYLALGGVVYFAGTDGGRGTELWRTDGTDAGTWMVADINPTGDADPRHFAALGGALYFVATDGVRGAELWRTDGTAAGTAIVADINPTGDGIPFSYKVVAVGGRLVFPATDGVSGFEPWRSDGTLAGTSRLRDIAPGAASSNPVELSLLNPTTVVFGAADPTNGTELWKTDGTPAGTVLVADIVSGAGDSLPDGWFRYFAVTGGVVYYRGTDGANGLELWRSDGTLGGTRMVADLVPGAGDGVYGSPWPVAALGLVFFQGRGVSGGYEPYVSDGTAPGTRPIADINPGGDSLPEGSGYGFHGWNGMVFLRATDGVTGYEPWVTTGAAGTTRQVVDLNPGGISDPTDYFEHQGRLYFQADDGVVGRELFTTDGTTTSLAADLVPGPGDGYPLYLGTAGDVAILAAYAPGGASTRLVRGY